MSTRVKASTWELIGADETGAMINIEYRCPLCKYKTGELIFVGPDNLSKINSDFETDQVCGICDEPLTIECHMENKI